MSEPPCDNPVYFSGLISIPVIINLDTGIFFTFYFNTVNEKNKEIMLVYARYQLYPVEMLFWILHVWKPRKSSRIKPNQSNGI